MDLIMKNMQENEADASAQKKNTIRNG